MSRGSVRALDFMLIAFIAGFLMGFIGSVPIAGPIAILVFERSARGRPAEARRIALGAAVAESFYAFAAYWGLATVIARVPLLLPASRVLGAVVISALGIYFIVRKPSKKEEAGAEVADQRGTKPLITGFTVTLVNPTLLATWAGAVTALSSMGVARANPLDALPFAGGVAIGIALWFMILTALVHRYREKISERTLGLLVKAMGVLLVVLGVVAGIRLATAPNGADRTPPATT